MRGVGIFAMPEEAKRHIRSLNGKRNGGRLKGFKYWIKDGESVKSKECPGEGWINGIIVPEKKKKHHEKLKSSSPVHTFDKITKENVVLYVPLGQCIGKFLRNYPNLELRKPKIMAMKLGVMMQSIGFSIAAKDAKELRRINSSILLSQTNSN